MAGGGGSSTSKTKANIPSWLGGPAQGIVSQWGQMLPDLMHMNPTELEGWNRMLSTVPNMEQAGRQALSGAEGILARSSPDSEAFRDFYESQARDVTDAYRMG